MLIDLYQYIDLTNGLYNNAPVATEMSPINIIVNESTAIIFPVDDPDGDTVRCRWTNSSNGIDECGGRCPPTALPPNTIIYPNCTIIITGKNITWTQTIAQFGYQVMCTIAINR